MPTSAETVLVDSGYWLALYDPRDQHHKEATGTEEYLQLVRPLVPWPTLYEVMRTRFVRRKDRLSQFEKTLQALQPTFIDDSKYRDSALTRTWRGSRSLSLADHVLRLILEDRRSRIDYVLTFNERDFTDILYKLNIPYFFKD
jgi:predicted nucleic acid-binding protein